MKTLITCLMLLALFVNQTVNAQSWTQQTSNTGMNLWGVHFFNNTTGLVCGDSGTMLKTTDGGDNWFAVNSGTIHNLGGLTFADANTGYTASWFAEGGIVYKTTDGGNSWNDISLNIPGGHSGGMWFFSADTGLFAIGDSNYANSKILKTTDGGSTWNTVYSPVSGGGWLSFFHFPDADNGYATVDDGYVLKTTDGGNNWTLLNLAAPDLWTSGVYFLDKDTGFVGGGYYPSDGALFKTTDGGNTWQNISTSIGASKILFTTSNVGYIVGGDSATNWTTKILLKTTNGGIDWAVDPTPGPNLNDIFFLSKGLGYSVGDSGTILKYEGLAGINDKLSPLNNKIAVYPNPFNTSTTIKIPEEVTIKDAEIKIYDLFGKQILNIENIKNREIIIDRKELSDGIYFYKLINGNVTIGTGKLIVSQ